MAFSSEDEIDDELNQAILASDSLDDDLACLSLLSSPKLKDSEVIISESFDESESEAKTTLNVKNDVNQKTPENRDSFSTFKKNLGWRSVASTTKKKKIRVELCYSSSDETVDSTSKNCEISKPCKTDDDSYDTVTTRNKSETKYNTSTETDDDEFEKFLTQCKTPKQLPKMMSLNGRHDEGFIVTTSDEENDGPEFHLTLRETSFKKPKKSTSIYKTPRRKHKSFNKGSMTEPRNSKFSNYSKESECDDAAFQPRLSFLSSLSLDVDVNKCDKTTVIYRTSFKNHKEELAQKLFSLFNNKIFNNQLPHDMEIEWNTRMRKTAGFCYTKRIPSTGIRFAKIELAPKVIDNSERLRDTLIHELCHAAVWIINGIRDGHGSVWRSWTLKARQVFPELPAISRCHSYTIHTKFVYKCTAAQCLYKIGRHSKSIDVTKKCCPYCRSKLELVTNSKKGNSKEANVSEKSTSVIKKNRSKIHNADENLIFLNSKFNILSIDN